MRNNLKEYLNENIDTNEIVKNGQEMVVLKKIALKNKDNIAGFTLDVKDAFSNVIFTTKQIELYFNTFSKEIITLKELTKKSTKDFFNYDFYGSKHLQDISKLNLFHEKEGKKIKVVGYFQGQGVLLENKKYIKISENFIDKDFNNVDFNNLINEFNKKNLQVEFDILKNNLWSFATDFSESDLRDLILETKKYIKDKDNTLLFLENKGTPFNGLTQFGMEDYVVFLKERLPQNVIKTVANFIIINVIEDSSKLNYKNCKFILNKYTKEELLKNYITLNSKVFTDLIDDIKEPLVAKKGLKK